MKNKQNILIIGSGGREHALAWKLAQSPRAGKLFVAPGNGGTAEIAENVAILSTDIPAVVKFSLENTIDLVVVTPDDPLAAGMVDALQAAGIRAFGPTKAAAQIEASKAFAKDLMQRQHIPTAAHQTFTDHQSALAHARSAKLPLVVKASGLALGKGVYICRTRQEAETALREIMLDARFGQAGNEVVIEDFLEGEEISIHAFSDGRHAILFPPSQDYKQIGEGDTGPNTGGIGAIMPVPWVTRHLLRQIHNGVVELALEDLRSAGTPFRGCLYPGLMVNNSRANVVEFNARLGDPEAEIYMRLLQSDLLDLIDASIGGSVKSTQPQWADGFAVCVVQVAGGYPESYKKGDVITGIDKANALEGVVVFHANTKQQGGELVTNGGRVLSITAIGKTLQQALDRAYAAAKLTHYNHMYYRRDIGFRVQALGCDS